MSDRKMAKVAKIEEIKPIPDADRIVAYRVGGWWIVDLVGNYNVGDLVIYCEIDSWIPNSTAPFLSKDKEPREFNGIKGERLRTIRLKKQLSQGLLLPISVITDKVENIMEGMDVSEILGIVKYEQPIPAQLAGMIQGNFPSLFPKTDAERVQNLGQELQEWIDSDVKFEVSMKLDGSSMSAAKLTDTVYVCSRNYSLKLDQEGNTFVETATKVGLIDLLAKSEYDLAIQGELIGSGIQNNQEKIHGHEFYVFEIFNVNTGSYMTATERREFCKANGLKHVPVLHESITLKELGITSIADALQYAEGPSLNPSARREGIVFKSENGDIKFKAISNAWLLKNE